MSRLWQRCSGSHLKGIRYANSKLEHNMANTYYVYILRCADDTLYTGWTTDVTKRVKTHNSGKGAKYTRARLPVERASFTFGGVKKKVEGYFITNTCIGCGSCVAVCPQNCIIQDRRPFLIEQEHCQHCGNCMTACPVDALERR